MSAARNLDAEFLMEERTIRLEERVASIQTDVAEIKVDYRRLDAKIDATRDSVSDVKDSAAALRVEMKDGFATCERRMAEFNASLVVLGGRLDTVASEGRATREELTFKTAELSARIDQKTDALSARIDQKTDALSARIDQKTTELSNVIKEKATDLSTKMAEDKASGLMTVNALFDRKFFRAVSVFIGAVAFVPTATVFALKSPLGLAEMTMIAAGVSVAILTGTFLATRTHR